MNLATYDVSLEVLSPLHIGTGEEVYPDADFVVERQQGGGRLARVVDVDRALAEMSAQEIASIRDGRIAAAMGERLRQKCTKALIPVRGQENVTRVRLLQRLSDGRPFIPGTTIKGSIRTALLRAFVRADQGLLQAVRGGTRATSEKRAAAAVEEAAFGVGLPARGRQPQFANRDLNRAIRVSDFVPEGEAAVAFVNMSAHHLGQGVGRGQRIPIWCEAIEPGSRFQGAITIEVGSPVWEGMAKDRQEAVNRLFRTWWEDGQTLLQAEEQVWARNGQVLAFLADAKQRRAVILGWGGGWRSKTLGTLLGPADLQEIASRYGLRRWQGRDFPHRFPVTRKLAASARGPVPPGWVAVVSAQKRHAPSPP